MRTPLAIGALAGIAFTALAGSALAQQKLSWAHVYEVTEPFHTESLWAAEEIKKRTDGRYEIAVFPASQLGKEADINQGLKLGTVDIIISGSSFAAREYPPIGITYYPDIFRDPDHLNEKGAAKEPPQFITPRGRNIRGPVTCPSRIS